jgi:hypothetical protein
VQATEANCYWRILGFIGDKATSDRARNDVLAGLRSAIRVFKSALRFERHSLSGILSNLKIQQAAALGAKQRAVAVPVEPAIGDKRTDV